MSYDLENVSPFFLEQMGYGDDQSKPGHESSANACPVDLEPLNQTLILENVWKKIFVPILLDMIGGFFCAFEGVCWRFSMMKGCMIQEEHVETAMWETESEEGG